MFSITVTEKGGEQRRLDFDKPEITIGRVQGNDVILPKGNVSKRHARIVLKDGKFIIGVAAIWGAPLRRWVERLAGEESEAEEAKETPGQAPTGAGQSL